MFFLPDRRLRRRIRFPPTFLALAFHIKPVNKDGFLPVIQIGEATRELFDDPRKQRRK